jgi:hypothetical protein
VREGEKGEELSRKGTSSQESRSEVGRKEVGAVAKVFSPMNVPMTHALRPPYRSETL